MKKFDKEIELIKTAHVGQTDRQGKPYYLHPMSVMNRLPASASDDVKIAALFHDLFEDTNITAEDLRKLGYSENIITMIDLLSRKPGPTYMEFIQNIVDSGNKGAILIKIADNEDNIDPNRIAQLPSKQQSIVKRYARSLKLLRSAL